MKPGILKANDKIKLNEKTYLVEGGINRGGSGEVYKISLGKANYALKLFFPFYQFQLGDNDVGALDEVLNLQLKEYDFLSTMTHPNIVSVIDHGMYELRDSERRRLSIRNTKRLPFLIEEFVHGETLDEALKSYPLSAAQIGFILSATCRALSYVHDAKRYMHADIKASNIMVREIDYQPVLVDFALAKNFNFDHVDKKETTPLEGDWDLFPNLTPDHPLRRIKESKKGAREDIFELAFPTLDLFDFGKMLEALMPLLAEQFDYKDRSYLETLTAELTNWEVVRGWSSKMLEDRISRLSPEQHYVFGVPELTAPGIAERTIMIPPDIGVPTTENIERLIQNRSFRRLAQIQQLALLSFIYPAADYKRFVHVLYSYHLGRQLATQLYASPLFRLYFDAKNCQKLLAVILAHDINHFPFLHIFQEAGIRGLERMDIIDFFCNGESTGEIAHHEPSMYDLLSEFGVDPDMFKRLIVSPHAEQKTPVEQVISSFINSGADIDKMSYLFLDGYFTGVKYGSGIDFPQLLKSARIEKLPGTGRLHLVYTDRGIQAAENLVMTRYWNFRSLYWHHTNRAVMSMILNVVRSLYAEREADVRNYLNDTMWMSDVEALRYLDKRYEDRFRKKSILSDLPQNRGRIYKRLYTVRAGGSDDADNELYKRLKKLTSETEKALRREIAESLQDYLSKTGQKVSIDVDDVLVDIPRREMDTGGKVYISAPALGGVRALDEVSKPVGAISANYELLTRRIRFFISPAIAKELSKEKREKDRKKIYDLIVAALDSVTRRSQAT